MSASSRLRASALGAVLLTALALAACGGGGRGEAASAASPEEAVRAAVTALGRATAAKDYRKLCDEILAPKLVEQVGSVGLPCTAALREGLGAVEDPRLTVGAITISQDTARAQVLTSAAGQEPSRDTIELVRVRGRWRIASLAS